MFYHCSSAYRPHLIPPPPYMLWRCSDVNSFCHSLARKPFWGYCLLKNTIAGAAALCSWWSLPIAVDNKQAVSWTLNWHIASWHGDTCCTPKQRLRGIYLLTGIKHCNTCPLQLKLEDLPTIAGELEPIPSKESWYPKKCEGTGWQLTRRSVLISTMQGTLSECPEMTALRTRFVQTALLSRMGDPLWSLFATGFNSSSLILV